MFNNITSGAFFATGVGAVIISKLGNIWGSISKYLHFGYIIILNNEQNYSLYQKIIKKIEQYGGSFNKTLTVDSNISSFGFGTFLVKVDMLTYIYLTHSQEKRENAPPMNNLSIKFIGVNAKKCFYEYYNMIKTSFEYKEGISIWREYRETIVPYKNFDSIFFEEKDKIIKFLDNFNNNKLFYKEHELTHKTGILLYGVPGTGKTSIVKAIATYMKYSIEIITDEIPSVLRKNTIYLMEEIDRLITQDRQENKEDAPPLSDSICIVESSNNPKSKTRYVSEMLQLLDGIIATNDVMFVATTNHIELLPPELIRCGRFDLKLELKDLHESLAKEMCDSFNVSYSILNDENFPINPAYLQTKILENI